MSLENEIKVPEKRNKYICPYPKCDLIPEVLSVHTDSGTIVLKCNRGHLCELDILEYFKILEEKKNLIPKLNYIDKSESKNEDMDISIAKINLKKKEITDIIKFNQLILSVQDSSPNNYNYNENLLNLEKFIKRENSLNTELDNIIKKEIQDKKEEERYALNKLEKEYYIDLERDLRNEEEFYLKLKGPKQEKYIKCLRDDGFRLISKLRFKNLIEINLANNKITNLEPLYNMLLPNLEIINFSDNYIEDITPLANLASHDLSEIYLQNNKIQDLGPFLNSNFPLLKIFKVNGESNKRAFNQKSFKAVLKKYENIIYYITKSWDDFNKEYEFKWENDIRRLDLSSIRKEKILKDLFSLIIYPNNIIYLILNDNKLQDVSLLSRMPLYRLELLDLSLNFISNIKFLRKISEIWGRLKILFLNDNKINDISSLVTYDEKNGVELIIKLDSLTLKHNYLDLKDKTTKGILEMLILLSEHKIISLDYGREDFYDDKIESHTIGDTGDDGDNSN